MCDRLASTVRTHACVPAPHRFEEIIVNTAATRSARLRRLGAGSAAAVALLAATGCSAVSPIATGIPYSPSDGMVADLDGTGIGVRNLAVVSTGAEEQGRVIGSVVNKSEEDVTVTVEVSGTSQDVEVPAGKVTSLEEEEFVVDKTGADAGEYTEGVLKADGDSQDLEIPVLGPTMKEYQDLAPGDVDKAQWEDHLHEETLHYGTDH